MHRSQCVHGKSKLSNYDYLMFLFNIVRIRFRLSDEFIKFCVVGASGVLVNPGIYILLSKTLKVPLEFASPVAIEISIMSNFMLNNV